MSTKLKQALKQAEEWDKHYVPQLSSPKAAKKTAKSFESRIADAITRFAGSMTFVYVHTVWFGLWMLINGGLLLAVGLHWVKPFDPFPFGLLTMVVSLEAIFLSTFVMIAQNRQADIADARAEADFKVNVRAEAEVAKLLYLVQTLVEHHILTSADVEQMREALAVAPGAESEAKSGSKSDSTADSKSDSKSKPQ